MTSTMHENPPKPDSSSLTDDAPPAAVFTRGRKRSYPSDVMDELPPNKQLPSAVRTYYFIVHKPYAIVPAGALQMQQNMGYSLVGLLRSLHSSSAICVRTSRLVTFCTVPIGWS